MSERIDEIASEFSGQTNGPIPIKDRAAINRANAARSTGPRTAAGKARSSMNAMQHGLTGHVTVMPGEDRMAHDSFCAAIVRHYGPEGALEIQIVQSIAEDEWRLNRARAIENNLLTLGADGPDTNIEADHPKVENALIQAQVFLNNQRVFVNMTLYETRIHRSIRQNEARLRTIQAEREKATSKATYETELLQEQAHSAGQSYDPAPDFPPRRGFVYSFAQVNRIINREKRLDEARRARTKRWIAENRSDNDD